jgi:hypothetical protein
MLSLIYFSYCEGKVTSMVWVLFVRLLVTVYRCVLQVGFELMILLPQPPSAGITGVCPYTQLGC